jgi:hypothetical protein
MRTRSFSIALARAAVTGVAAAVQRPAPAGSLVFFASMVPHTVRNTGTVPATYHVVNWAALGTKGSPAEAR